MRKLLSILAVASLLLVASPSGEAQKRKLAPGKNDPVELPRPTWENCFWLTIQRTKEKDPAFATWEDEYADIVKHLGKGGMYARLNYDGVSLSTEFRAEQGLYESYVFNSPLDSLNPAYKSEDRRARQWNQRNELVDAKTCAEKGNPADADLTPSYYCREAWEGMLTYVKSSASDYMRRKESERFTIFAGPNEYEYVFFGGDAWYSDYSPFAVAEFRDWLSHRGHFDKGGALEGKGRKGGEELSDDPSPARAKGANRCFNELYGTKFTSWELLYWDLDKFPDSLPKNANGMPAKGEKGFTEGGFDSPRAPGAAMWALYQNNSKEAPGYRQWRIADGLNTMLKAAVEECGVPRADIWTRQHGCAYRGPGVEYAHTSLAPWMNVTPYNNIGWNLYGVPRDAKVWAAVQQMAEESKCDWGSFEFHPSPFELNKISQADYLLALNLFYDYGARYIRCVTWLGNNTGKSEHGMAAGTMRIRDTPFEPAIKEFLATRPDRPWGSDAATKYVTPAPRNLAFDGTTLTWDAKMWESEKFTFDDWAEFEFFEIACCDAIEEGKPKGLRTLGKLERAKGVSYTVKAKDLKPCLIVRGVCKGKLNGPWSAAATQ
jgi:hypothetical protein